MLFGRNQDFLSKLSGGFSRMANSLIGVSSPSDTRSLDVVIHFD